MRTLNYYILTITLLSILIAPRSLQAQQHANASASVTVNVVPSTGVEVQQQSSSQNAAGVSKQEFEIKVNATGNYSLRILDGASRSATLSKELGTRSSYRLQERTSGSKQIVQLALLSS